MCQVLRRRRAMSYDDEWHGCGGGPNGWGIPNVTGGLEWRRGWKGPWWLMMVWLWPMFWKWALCIARMPIMSGRDTSPLCGDRSSNESLTPFLLKHVDGGERVVVAFCCLLQTQLFFVFCLLLWIILSVARENIWVKRLEIIKRCPWFFFFFLSFFQEVLIILII